MGVSMARQTIPIARNCQFKDCVRDAVIGVYMWDAGASDVDLNRPVRVFCGEHKPKLRLGWRLRNVRLRREASPDDAAPIMIRRHTRMVE
jgi:hypothetical protein